MIRSLVAAASLLGLAAMPLHAQMPATPPHDSATTDQKTPLAPKKVESAGSPAKDAAAKKPPSRKAAPKAPKDDKKKAAPKKAQAKTPAIKPIGRMEPLHDDKGNKIPITPDAYDVSSALPGKAAPGKATTKK